MYLNVNHYREKNCDNLKDLFDTTGCMNNELIVKLNKSEAVSSLNIEKEIHSCMKKHKWDPIRSPYFKDTQSGKYREIDIIARHSYEGLSDKNTALLVEMILVVECKSLSGYHIIADGKIKLGKYDKDHLHTIWLGYELDSPFSKTNEILDKTQLSKSAKDKVIKSLSGLMYPKHNSVYKNLTPAPFNLARFTAFRETNLGTIKEIDNSVMWKSFMSLNSVAESFDSFQWGRIEEDLLWHCKNEKSDLGFKKRANSLSFQVLNKYIGIHKILVVDANIWANDKMIKPLPYFRFMQRNIYGTMDQWIDVVNVTHINKYMKYLSGYYNNFFSNTEMRQIK